MVDSLFQKISGAVQNHFDFAFDFYGLDFWKDHSPLEGYQVAVDEFVDVAEAKLAGRNQWLQAGAASTLEVARLFGAMPVAVHHWWIEAAKESHRGIWAMAYRAVEIPVQGFLHGARYVGDAARGWFNGSLNEQSSFRIASEVTGVLGAVVFMAMGARSIASGGGKIVRGTKAVAADVSSVVASNQLAAATATASIDGALILQGARQAMGGPVYWMAVGNPPRSGKTSEEEGEAPSPRREGTSETDLNQWIVKRRQENVSLAEALERHEGRVDLAADDVGLHPRVAWLRIRRALPDEPLARFKKKGGGSFRKAVSDADLIRALEKHKGDRLKAGWEVGLRLTDVADRIREAQPGSPLLYFQRIRGERFYRIEADLAQALEKHGGNRIKAEMEVGMDADVSRRIREAQPGSPLERFKRGKQGVAETTLAQALEKHGGNRAKAGIEVGLSKATVVNRIRDAQPGSPLVRFKGTGKKGPRVSDTALARALDKHYGIRKLAAKALGINASSISQRIRQAKPDSPLAAFQKTTEAPVARAKPAPHQSKPISGAPDPAVGLPKDVGAPVPALQRPLRFGDAGYFRSLDERICRGLEKGWSPRKIAGRKGMLNQDDIPFRLKAAPDASPLAPFARRQGVQRVSDQQIAKLLGEGQSIDQAAQVLRIERDVIEERLWTIRDTPQWGKDSPLVPFLHLLDTSL